MDSNLKRLSMQVNVDDLLPASEKEKEYMVKMRPSTTAFQDGVRRLRKNKVAMVSFWIILLITVGGAAAGVRGILLSVPLALCIRAAVHTLGQNHDL